MLTCFTHMDTKMRLYAIDGTFMKKRRLYAVEKVAKVFRLPKTESRISLFYVWNSDYDYKSETVSHSFILPRLLHSSL